MALTKVLVTGGTGFLGSAIVSALVDTKRYDVTAIDINPPALGTGAFSSVRYVRANILQPSELVRVFKEAKPAIVVHTVGVYPLGQKRYSQNAKEKEAVFEVNVSGTRSVLDAAKECGVRGFVYTSSITVVMDELGCDFWNVDERWPVGRASLSYGQSKAAAESLVLASNTPTFHTTILRPALIFGPNDPSTIPVLHSMIPTGETCFQIGPGTNLVDLVYLSNAADAHVLAVSNLLSSCTAAGETFFITNGEPLPFRDFMLGVWKEFGHVPRRTITISTDVAWGLGMVAEWVGWAVGKETKLSRGSVADATSVRFVSIQKARRVLGYEPRVGMVEGVRITVEDFKTRFAERAKKK